uniref:Uncharacterized protein n=1 Tax=Xanthomonas campestris pv. glycines TaxID=473421 RepID=Q8GLV6_XANCG|nr:unknown [Xanthomonas citri pv. glycines]
MRGHQPPPASTSPAPGDALRGRVAVCRRSETPTSFRLPTAWRGCAGLVIPHICLRHRPTPPSEIPTFVHAMHKPTRYCALVLHLVRSAMPSKLTRVNLPLPPEVVDVLDHPLMVDRGLSDVRRDCPRLLRWPSRKQMRGITSPDIPSGGGSGKEYNKNVDASRSWEMFSARLHQPPITLSWK